MPVERDLKLKLDVVPGGEAHDAAVAKLLLIERNAPDAGAIGHPQDSFPGVMEDRGICIPSEAQGGLGPFYLERQTGSDSSPRLGGPTQRIADERDGQNEASCQDGRKPSSLPEGATRPIGLRRLGGLGTRARRVAKTAWIGMVHNRSHIQLVANFERLAQRILRVSPGCKGSD